ncbi:MAG: glycosyltransferase family 2 protein [Cyanobacteriota bacterium]
MKEDPPIVTVILTVYRRTRFLSEALASAQAQTLSALEIIVADDSDCQDIRSICDSFQDPRIRYRANPFTLGVAMNLRAAIGEAKGKYIAILNDDDAWEADFLEKLVTPLEEDPALPLAFSDHWIMSEDGRIDQRLTEENSARYGRKLLPRGTVANFEDFVLLTNGVPLAMASLFRRGAFDLDWLVQDVGGAYDFWISCLIAASGRSAFYVPERLTRYRIHTAMETGRKAPDKSENMTFIYQTLLRMEAFPRQRSWLTKRSAGALYRNGRDKLYFNFVSEARTSFIQSLKTSAGHKSIIGLIVSYLPKEWRRTLRFSM